MRLPAVPPLHVEQETSYLGLPVTGAPEALARRRQKNDLPTNHTHLACQRFGILQGLLIWGWYGIRLYFPVQGRALRRRLDHANYWLPDAMRSLTACGRRICTDAGA